MIESDVIGARGSNLKPYGFADNKRDSFGLCLAHNLGCGGAPLGLVQHLMRQLMEQSGEGFGLRLSGENGNASAVAHAKRGSDVLAVDKLDALTLDERNETVVVLAYVAVHLAHGGKLDAFGLLHIEYIGIPKANKDAGVLLGDVLLGFCVWLALDADDGSKNADALLALLHAAAKLVPCIHARNARGCRALSCDL